MDNNNKNSQQSNQLTTEDLTRSSYEYLYPINDGDECESNKSTPYFTPLEFFQGSFEFPSPILDKTGQYKASDISSSSPALQLTTSKSTINIGYETPPTSAVEYPCYTEAKKSISTPTQKNFAAVNPKQLQTTTSPALHRKLRRFSLYERRSCSPHLLLKNTSSASVDCNERLLEPTENEFVYDKENTKPRTIERSGKDDNMQLLSKSGNSSPITLLEDSPNIIAGPAENRLPYSPKLLASINFLNLGGSPLGVINSAGYKNGNYFKFPEVDYHAVQDGASHCATHETTAEESAGQCDNHMRNRQKFTVGLCYDTSPALPTASHKVRLKSDLETVKNSHTTDDQKDLNKLEDAKSTFVTTAIAVDCKKNRKNKNNLTIKISDSNSSQYTLTSPSSKPKTPTIKSTKEKALSLDSAANVPELSVPIVSSRDQTHISCDQINLKLLKTSNDHLLGQTSRSINVSHEKLKPPLVLRGSSPATNRSTSLSQLASLSSTDVAANHLYAGSYSIFNKPGGNLIKTPRRKVLTTSSNEWLHYHRKQNPFNIRPDNAATALNQNLSLDANKRSAPDTDSNEKIFLDLNESVVLKEDDETTHTEDGSPIYRKHIPSSSNNPTPATPLSSLSTPHRGLHKHNPLLHSSSTNLKTLPEFLTLVEFSHKDSEYPYKQKSFDLPSSSSIAAAPALAHPPTIRTKSTISNSSTSLLQRRGSNHSLTLNLHGSCSNLLGSCRSGLSVSNYSLGSAANSTTNLNSKSSYNLDLSATSHAPTLNIVNPGHTSQGIKQSLFRRRSSNNSLTLNNLSATSCSNLKSFCSQNSLNSEHSSHLLQAAAGVTRTTSFVTSTKNTASSSVAPKRGLLERRGSNQSLTLNMSGSLGGIGSIERNSFGVGGNCLGDIGTTDNVNKTYPRSDLNQPTSTAKCEKNFLPVSCAQSHHRKFFSSENLTKANTQFSDLNQAHKRNSQQVCFGSVSDLKPSERDTNIACLEEDRATIDRTNINSSLNRDIDFQDSTVCTCTGVRNITTRPLSPQTTSEEFKIYLANIQMLQNATNALNQLDLIKLNYIFDNSYALASSKNYPEQSISILNTMGAGVLGKSVLSDSPTPPGLMSTSEDYEIASRYQQVVNDILSSIKLEDEDQKRMFRELHKEFWDLPLNHQEKPMVFGSQTKNRYKTILPNENSRLILDNEWTHERRSDLSTSPKPYEILTSNSTSHFVVSEEAPYINANFIKGPDFTSKCYIATQGPLPNTIFEFWLMIYQNTHKHFEQSQLSTDLPLYATERKTEQYYQKIVMLTNFLEHHRQKCSVYFPVDLNEIFISTGNQESISPTKEISDFFHEYLTSNIKEDSHQQAFNVNKSEDAITPSIETKIIELPTEIYATLPHNINYFVIKNVGIVKKNGFSIRKFCILYCIDSFKTAFTNTVDNDSAADKTHQRHRQLLVRKFYCYHYWYPDWPDHRSPKDINTLLDICLHILNIGKCEQEFESFCDQVQHTHKAQHVDQYQQDLFNDIQPLPVVHCSAGIGRTGCLAAILNGVRQLRQSLAYSLISMAAAAVPKNDVEIPNLSPIDFRLPKQYLAEEAKANCINDHTADTDSSFTRNTLLYVKYILNKNISNIKSNDTTLLERRKKLPSLNELPKMPDVYVDVLGIVCNLRLQRGGMVQNSEQYELIHRGLCLYLKRTFALKHF